VLIGVRPSVLSATQPSPIFAAATRFSAVVRLRMMRAGRTSTAAFCAAHHFGTVRLQFTAWALSPYCLSLCSRVARLSRTLVFKQFLPFHRGLSIADGMVTGHHRSHAASCEQRGIFDQCIRQGDDHRANIILPGRRECFVATVSKRQGEHFLSAT
jgi:hypothetical protein